QLAFGWTIGWGQYVIAILLTVLLLTPMFGMPSMAGALIEIAVEGGHGTAAGMQGTFEKLGFPEGYDLSIGLATVGVLTGIIRSQLAVGWTIGWGQYVIAILLTVLLLTPMFGMPSMAGALIEIAFEGGHGTAAGMQGTFEKLGFPEGYDLSIGLATVGVLTGII